MSLLIKENSNKRKTRQPWITEVKNYLVISEKVCLKNSPAFDNLKLKPNCTDVSRTPKKSKMKRFATIVNGYYFLTITKLSILDVCESPKYTYEDHPPKLIWSKLKAKRFL